MLEELGDNIHLLGLGSISHLKFLEGHRGTHSAAEVCARDFLCQLVCKTLSRQSGHSWALPLTPNTVGTVNRL